MLAYFKLSNEKTIQKIIAYGVILGGGFLPFPIEVLKVPPNKLCRSVPLVAPSTPRLFRLLLLCLLARLELSNGSFFGDLGDAITKAEEVESAAEELLLERVSSFTVDEDPVERRRCRRFLVAEGPFPPCKKI